MKLVEFTDSSNDPVYLNLSVVEISRIRLDKIGTYIYYIQNGHERYIFATEDIATVKQRLGA